MNNRTWFLLYKLTELESNGLAYVGLFHKELDFLRNKIERESNGRRSVRICPDRRKYCEVYIVR
jgi:hypothetical protein